MARTTSFETVRLDAKGSASHWLLALGILAAVLINGLGTTASAQVVIRAGIPDPYTIPHSKAMILFKNLVERRSNGEIEVQLFPALQLGEIVEQIHSVQDGTQEMMQSTAAWFSRFYPAIDVVELPYLVTDWESADRMYRSEAMKKLQVAAEEATGIKILGWFAIGFRHTLNTKQPIHNPDDFSGMKLRLQDSPVHIATFRALGANPIVVPWGDTPSALETGLVDGLENSLANFVAVKFYEHAKYLSMTGHFFNMTAVYINADFYNKLSDEQKRIIDDAIMAGEQMSLILAREQEESGKVSLRDLGVEVNDLSPEEIQALKEKVRPVYSEFGTKFEPFLADLQAASLQ